MEEILVMENELNTKKIVDDNEPYDSLKFIAKRIKDPKYRGNIASQHNRYTINEMLKIMIKLDKFAPSNKEMLQIRNKDLSVFQRTQLGAEKYSEMVKEINNDLKRTTEDSLRKTFFPDLHRMGFIERFNAKKEITDPFTSSPIKYFRVTKLGEKFINSNIVDRNLIFSKGLNKMLKGYIDNISDILTDESYDFKYLTEYELMFFVSAINENASYSITIEKCKDYIKDFRQVSTFRKEDLINTLKIEMDPKKYDSGNKTEKKDFHNFKNKFDQILTLLDQSDYFEVNNKGKSEVTRLTLRGISNSDDTDEILVTRKRSVVQKQEYFKNNNIRKENYKGFQLHHIIEFSEAETYAQLKLIDNWKNMVLIDGQKHNEITCDRNKVKYYLFDYDENEVDLHDLKNKNKIEFLLNKEIGINKNNLELVKEYNTELYKSF